MLILLKKLILVQLEKDSSLFLQRLNIIIKYWSPSMSIELI